MLNVKCGIANNHEMAVYILGPLCYPKSLNQFKRLSILFRMMSQTFELYVYNSKISGNKNHLEFLIHMSYSVECQNTSWWIFKAYHALNKIWRIKISWRLGIQILITKRNIEAHVGWIKKITLSKKSDKTASTLNVKTIRFFFELLFLLGLPFNLFVWMNTSGSGRSTTLCYVFCPA